MIKLVMIEDEQPAIDKMRYLLAQQSQPTELLAQLGSVEEAVNWLNSHPAPDLILMDIQLSDGICFEIFESVNLTTPVIFTTAYDEYAIRAFKVNSVDYLLKPVDPEMLAQALNKFKLHFPPYNSQNISQVMTQLPPMYKSRFLVKTGLHFKSVPVTAIESFFVQQRSVFLLTDEGKTRDIDYSLDQLEKMVNPNDFFRVNRNFLINIQHIKDMIGYSGNRIKVKMEVGTYDEPIIVSREKVAPFKQWMDR